MRYDTRVIFENFHTQDVPVMATCLLLIKILQRQDSPPQCCRNGTWHKSNEILAVANDDLLLEHPLRVCDLNATHVNAGTKRFEMCWAFYGGRRASTFVVEPALVLPARLRDTVLYQFV